MSIFKDRLKDMRSEAGISQKNLAEAIGVSDVAVCKWEKGEAEPKVSYLIRLAEFFECTVDYLVGKADDFGNSKPPEVAPNIKLTKTEKQFICDYRELSQTKKSLIRETVTAWKNINTEES